MRWIFALVLLTGGAFAQSQQPPVSSGEQAATHQAKTNSSSADANDKRGTLESPLIVRSIKSEEETKNDKQDRDDKAFNDHVTIALGVAVAFVGLFQFIALVGQILTVRAQLRAHVFPESAGLYEGSVLNPPRADRLNVPGVVLIWKNTGQTPASNVVSWGLIAVIPVTQEHTLVQPPLKNVYSSHLGAGAAGNKTLWFERALTSQEIAGIHAGTTGIYLYGRLEYQDVFRRRRWTNFRLIYTQSAFPPVTPGAGFSVCEQGNDAGYGGRVRNILYRLKAARSGTRPNTQPEE